MTRTILLADDSITIHKVIELTFPEEEYRVVAVENGDAALARLDETDPDLVIADVVMPGADGYQVAHEVKQRRPSTPVLLLVSTFEPYDEERARESGADRRLTKPFDAQELQRVVEELLAGSGEGAGNEEPGDAAHAAETGADEPTAGRSPVGFAFGEPEPPVERVGSARPAPAEPEEVAWAPSPDADEAADEPDAASPLAPPAAEEDPFGELAAEPVGATEADPAIFETPPESFVGTAPGAEPHLPDEPVADEAQAPAAPGAGEDEPEARDGEAAEPAEGIGLPSSPADQGADEAPEPPAPVESADAGGHGGLSDDDVDRIARRVVELLADRSVEEIAWEVVPDVAEIVIKERLRELEARAETDESTGQ